MFWRCVLDLVSKADLSFVESFSIKANSSSSSSWMRYYIELYIIIYMVLLFSSKDLGAENSTIKGEYNLLKDLLNTARYNKRVRPVRSSQESVNVTFGLAIREIEDLVINH